MDRRSDRVRRTARSRRWPWVLSFAAHAFVVVCLSGRLVREVQRRPAIDLSVTFVAAADRDAARSRPVPPPDSEMLEPPEVRPELEPLIEPEMAVEPPSRPRSMPPATLDETHFVPPDTFRRGRTRHWIARSQAAPAQPNPVAGKPASSTGPARVERMRTAPMPLSTNRPPAYPDRARALGLEGVVVVLARVNREGDVDGVEVERSSGSSLLDRMAVETIRRWRFRPATLDGHPIEATVEVPVRFRLGSS